jgi:hypothetical protein
MRFQITIPVHVMSGVHIDHLAEGGVTGLTVTFEIEAPTIEEAVEGCSNALGVLAIHGTSFKIEQIEPAPLGNPL